MAYERIHKVPAGVISPSKLRLKLLGPYHHRGKEGGGSRSNSSRTSPSKLENAEHGSCLLSDQNGDFKVEGCSKDSTAVSLSHVSSLEASAAKFSIEKVTYSNQVLNGFFCNENVEPNTYKMENMHKGVTHHVHSSANLRFVHPARPQDEDIVECDSGHDNVCSTNFEFHKGEKILHNPIRRAFSHAAQSKWNDAERWIINPNAPRKISFQQGLENCMRVVPEPMISEQKGFVPQFVNTKQVDSCNLTSEIEFSPKEGTNAIINGEQEGENQQSDAHGNPSVRTVSMRDTGTEMTPMTSQEPSRTGTPIGSTTPMRSPISSLPSTPRGEPVPLLPMDDIEIKLDHHEENNKKGLSEKELRQRTRREILALGVKLGKMNIAAWASNEEKGNADAPMEAFEAEKLGRVEFEARAAAWEEAEKSKHAARYKREEIRIEAWESRQRSKTEAKMRRIEAQVERLRSHAHEKLINKLTLTRQRAEDMRAAAEARKNRQAAKTAEQVEYMHRTGRLPSSNFLCCSWFP